MKIVQDNISINPTESTVKTKVDAFNLDTAQQFLANQEKEPSVEDIDITSEEFADESTDEQAIQQFRSHVLDRLVELGGPDTAALKHLSQSFGDIFIYHHDDDNIFVCHPFNRQLWRKILKGEANIIGAYDREENIFGNGVIWPDPRKNQILSTIKAGIIDTVAALIMVYSGFVNPEYAMSKVIPI